MRPASVYLEDTVNQVEGQARSFLGVLTWHPTDRELNKEEEGACCCEWCLACEGWWIIAEESDEQFQKARDKIDTAYMRQRILDAK